MHENITSYETRRLTLQFANKRENGIFDNLREYITSVKLKSVKFVKLILSGEN